MALIVQRKDLVTTSELQVVKLSVADEVFYETDIVYLVAEKSKNDDDFFCSAFVDENGSHRNVNFSFGSSLSEAVDNMCRWLKCNYERKSR